MVKKETNSRFTPDSFWDDGEVSQTGHWVSWYEDGQIQMIYNYKKGQLHGNQKRWYENGQLKAEWNYLNDKQDGILKEWHEDGKIKTIKKFINGNFIETLESN